jgi:hypothetical protein
MPLDGVFFGRVSFREDAEAFLLLESVHFRSSAGFVDILSSASRLSAVFLAIIEKCPIDQNRGGDKFRLSTSGTFSIERQSVKDLGLCFGRKAHSKECACHIIVADVGHIFYFEREYYLLSKDGWTAQKAGASAWQLEPTQEDLWQVLEAGTSAATITVAIGWDCSLY